MTTPNNTTTPQGPYTYNSGISSTNPFVEVYSLRNPSNASDVSYPIQKRWINFNTSPPSEWILESLPVVANVQSANWVQLSGGGSGTLLHLNVPLGSSPVVPDGTGGITYTSTGNSISITGSTNTVNFDITGGGALLQQLETDDGLFETPTGNPGTITIHGANNITTSQGTAHQVNISVSGTANHEVQVGNASGSLTSIANGSTGTVLKSQGASANPTYSSAFTLNASDVMTNTAQPCINAYLSGNVSNASGAGGSYQLGTTGSVPLTIAVDQSSSLTTGGVFTVPVAGIYYFYFQICWGNLASDMTYAQITIQDSTGGKTTATANPYAIRNTNDGKATMSCTYLTYLAAAVTVTFTAGVSGDASNSCSVQNFSNNTVASFVVGFKVA